MTKDDLINELIKDGYLKTPAIIEAFKKIDRQDFIPEGMKPRAYENTALPIGKEQTISQPIVVAFMLELLDLKPGEKVLEIGTGSGWNTALMAYLAGGAGNIVSIERISDLHEYAEKNLAKYDLINPAEPVSSSRQFAGIISILGDGSKGYLEKAPYDKIIAAASAEEIPGAWKEQLKIGGRIVAPVKNSIFVVDKIAKNKFEIKEYFGFDFVPLVSR